MEINNLRERIMEATDRGRRVFEHYYGPINAGRKYRNKTYDDKNASCTIKPNKKSGDWMLYDFGDPDRSGDCFWLVQEMEGTRSFPDTMKRIIEMLHLPIVIRDSFTHREVKKTPPTPSKQTQPVEKKMKPYKFQVKDWSNTDVAYWSKYGIKPETLSRYGVVTLASYTSEGENGPYKIVPRTESPLFGYQGIGYMKIYRPFEKNRFQWGGNIPDPYIFGFEQLPVTGDMVFITGGEKDVLTLAAHGYHAICFNSETANIPDDIVGILSTRFGHIIIMFDCDETGIREMDKAREKFANNHKVMFLQLPLSGTKIDKDISDFFYSGRSTEEFHDLIEVLFWNGLSIGTRSMASICEIDPDNPPPESQVIISTEGVPIGSTGNLMFVGGMEGTGKSNFINAMIAGTLLTERPSTAIDTLGYDVALNYRSQAVLHFDTEQSRPQQHKKLMATLKRAGIEEKPKFYRSFNLSMLSRSTRLQFITELISFYNHKFNGLFLVVIDGLADLIGSVNDEKECVDLVEEFFRIAGFYNTCVMGVLHYVPNGLKLRGHLGSEAQRKATGIVVIEKEDDDSSIVKATKVREGNPLDAPIQIFKWDKQLEMHVYVGKKSEEDKAQRKYNELLAVAKTIFASVKTLDYRTTWTQVMNETDVKERTAKEYVSWMLKNGILDKTENQQYQLKQD